MYIGNNLFIESGDYTFAKGTKIEKDLKDLSKILVNQNNYLDVGDLNPLSYIFNLENGVQISHSIKLNMIYDQYEKKALGKITNATLEEKMEAINFTLTQLGKPYQWFTSEERGRANPNITDPNHPYYNWTIKYDPYIDYWYCTELIWAGYLHQNIQIDPEPVTDPKTEIETLTFWSSRDYFNGRLIDISRLKEWEKWRFI
jgi:hypothetical protein